MIMRASIYFFLAAMTSLSALALAGEGSGVKGGGGIERSGQYLTFGSAKVRLDCAINAAEIPGMAKLRATLRDMPMQGEWRRRFYSAFLPLGERRYCKLNALPPAERKELLESYRKLVPELPSGEKLVIYAVTKEKETYLLPEFFKLQKEEQQAALLFHEMLWVLKKGQASYVAIVDAEIKFQSYLEASGARLGFEPELYSALDRILQSFWFSVSAAAMEDMRDGRLASLVDAQGRLPISILFGPQFLCDGPSFEQCDRMSFESRAEANFIKLMDEHPDARVFTQIYRNNRYWRMNVDQRNRYGALREKLQLDDPVMLRFFNSAAAIDLTGADLSLGYYGDVRLLCGNVRLSGEATSLQLCFWED